jgi:hypothetical protein
MKSAQYKLLDLKNTQDKHTCEGGLEKLDEA